uniref:5'-3' exoribonuclease 1 n=1 Tax=Heliothis virescens TaxID=7102 RepID=A0A2A4JDB6_HELVI
MGVPKFFRYTSERYPCLNELVKQYQIPDFDNMYLDMNGIIHNCSHPDDSNPHFRITEEKIFQDIFHYLSILFQIIKPKKLFFMAIDGVAPRAKMNQQRGRRFRSAREAEKLEAEAREKGEVLPTEKRFDSNCITPGTVFMARLHEQLKYFIKFKMSTDPLWSKVKVVLSGHETPGEGEHKIMDYIRWSRSQPDYDPNTRHCLYGLDADLIMLGMCTHEPHFALLREEVKFGRSTQRATSPEETNFYLLHLSLLREYLEQEFISIKGNLPFPYDIEKIVDDWVLMGFLVGNDFIPNLPNMHISNDALPVLYKTYMTVLPTLDGYINEAGDLNLRRFEVFMQELAKIDKEKFQDTYADLKYFEAKTGRRPNANERREYKPNNDDTFNVNIEDIKSNKPDDELQALINATQDMFMDDMDNDNEDEYEETSDEEANMEMEFILHKKDYYMNKLDYSKVTEEVLADQAEGYVRAIQWNLHYYYKGCPSWCWYYPHHYAPYISDIKGFKDLKIEFELGDPFKPFEQLLAVLPAASKQLLPAPFHDLMTDEDSPIVHYYPQNFETDLNGKRNDWEAVVLIPFIDEVNLLSAMEPCYQRLTEEEKKRNSHGPMMVYNWTPQNQGVTLAPEYFPAIPECFAIERQVWRQEIEVPGSMLRRGMLPNAKRDMLYPGFPTMRHLKYQTSLKKGKVKVFDQPSRNDNMIVEIIRDTEQQESLDQVAQDLLGRVIWVGWPHLTRAKVISVSDEKRRLHHVDKQNNNVNGAPTYTTEANFGNLHKQWISERSTIIEHNMNRLGIELGDVKIIIHAVNLKGFKYMIQDNVTMVQEPEWCSVACGYAHQAVLRDVRAHTIQEGGKFSTPQEAYPPGDTVFLLTQGQHYGSLATAVLRDVRAHTIQEGGKFSTPQEAYPPGDTVFLLTQGQHYGSLATAVLRDVRAHTIQEGGKFSTPQEAYPPGDTVFLLTQGQHYGSLATAVLRDVRAHTIQEGGKFSTPQEAYPPGDTVFLLTQGQHYGSLATAVLRDVRAHTIQEGGKFSTPQEAYPPGDTVFLLTQGQHYGSLATAVLRDVRAHTIQEGGKFSTPQEAYPPGDTVFLLTQGQHYGSLATAVLRDVRAHTIQEGGKFSTPQEAYPPGDTVFLLTQGQHYGSLATEGGKFSTPQEAYPPGDTVFLLTQGQHYGSLATVVDSESIRSGRIKVMVRERGEPVPSANAAATPYRTANHAAAACGISAQMMSRITGTVLVVTGERHDMPTEQLNKINIGLNLKFNKKNLEVSGYTRRCKVTNAWLYSERCIELVKSYERQFPDLFDSLASTLNRDVYFESDLFPGVVGKNKAQDIAQWIKSQPHTRALRRECGSEALEPEEMKILAASLDKQLAELAGKEKKVTLQVKWNLLYKPELHCGNISPDPRADFRLYDRVVCVSRHMSVPLGAAGTITAVLPPPNTNTVRLSDKLNADNSYLVMFDQPFPGAMSEDLFDVARFYRLSPNNMLNLSYGRKLRGLVNTAPPQDSFLPQASPQPNLLRRDDGHHSAFANYSPPGDKAVSPDNRNHVSNAPPSNGPPTQDNATHLLRSLLKISETDADAKKPKTTTPEQNRNWRVKNDNLPHHMSQPPRGPPQPSNWRKENAPRPPPTYNAEWNNSYKSQPPLPPYPTFGQPFQGPGPSQIPFPQFQNPHFQQRNQFTYRNQDNQRNNPPRTFENPFPKHLPSVGAVGPNVTLGPSWNQPNNQVKTQNVKPPPPAGNKQAGAPAQNNADKVNNPFVPLQVQTSQRRVSQPGGSSNRRDSEQMPAPKSTLPKPQPTNTPIVQQNQDPTPRPMKKKKPRIAANLPFQID